MTAQGSVDDTNHDPNATTTTNDDKAATGNSNTTNDEIQITWSTEYSPEKQIQKKQ